MSFNLQAQELNAIIVENNPAILDVLSLKGKEAYFPKHGILSQSLQASGCKINATIGIALEEDKSTACLPSLAELTRLEGYTTFQYAPSSGIDELRNIWHEMMFEKNPSLKGVPISLPVVTSALTHAIYIAGQMFLETGDRIILSDYFWENYELVFCRSTGAKYDTYPTFTIDGKYNIEGLRDAVSHGGAGKKVLLLNFPNNPTGYTPTVEEANKIRDILVEEAQRGSSISVIIDDAYFGLVFENGIFTESFFSLLADAHENILAIKADAATKEDYAWGLRTGFLTFGVKGGNKELYRALEEKVSGFIREQISSASKMSQSLLVRAYKHPNYRAEKAEKFDLLKKRYEKVKEILDKNKKYADYFYALPFNSGYFMCVCPKKNIDAEKLRVLLAEKYLIGLIQLQGLLRIAFSSTSINELEEVFESVYKSCIQLAGE
ncbi:MAG: aminotransferase class I/II-fold pyridoxal phosphate-dependent enzyme [Chitinispirillales bacterium]|jgi:aspartate/methionine/tyrosine aminotransferase|nr:aminotransferase class I/II-fold pyridoxal phosphate-dependent enzyme [Chitinispirillales bacterium]